MLQSIDLNENFTAYFSNYGKVNVDILTLGQYLQPTKKHIPVDRFVTPDEFRALKTEGLKMGFKYVLNTDWAKAIVFAIGMSLRVCHGTSTIRQSVRSASKK